LSRCRFRPTIISSTINSRETPIQILIAFVTGFYYYNIVGML
jgi:hypothetical protein